MYEIPNTDLIAMDESEYLEHFGVKGMRWGHRKAYGHTDSQGRYKNLKRAQKKYDKKASSGEVFAKSWNSAADDAEKKGGLVSRTNSKISALYKKHGVKSVDELPISGLHKYDKIFDDYNTEFKSMRALKVKDILGDRPSEAANTRVNRKNGF